ncbi:LysR family transcriptional regulator [Hoeflea poritis]|uniref:LysR family transcriptional regulator n=1 Tax=Hoeflea poritis TaxID=2993659 RepID=A0ABT4VSX2_9HYPH|nr:LysR family transcriptional regulator [Hoeflea poritis]MDA4847812.1 LysR family transcriptional regulator [Hoeflea poritis]
MTTAPALLSRKLHVFAAVYDTCSTTAAAALIGLTQSAVSKSISQLEADLGVKLFERTLQGLRPMPTADALRRRCRWIERELDLAASELHSAASLENVVLHIGSGPVWNVRLLPAFLPGYCADNPQVRLDIVTGSGDYLVPRMIDGTLDVYFGVLSDELDRPGLHCERLLSMELQVYARFGHPMLQEPQPPLDSLVNYPWIGFSSDNKLQKNVSEWGRKLGIPTQLFSLRLMSLAAMMSVAKESDHLIFAVDALEHELTRNGLARVPIPFGPGQVISGIAVRSSIAELPPIEDLMERARKVRQTKDGIPS